METLFQSHVVIKSLFSSNGFPGNYLQTNQKTNTVVKGQASL